VIDSGEILAIVWQEEGNFEVYGLRLWLLLITVANFKTTVFLVKGLSVNFNGKVELFMPM